MTMNNKTNISGMSMIEILIGTTIFMLAMLPLFMLGGSNTKEAHSAGKHMMASQIAANVIERLVSKTYKECRQTANELAAKDTINVLDDEDIIAAQNSDEKVADDMSLAFKHFSYTVRCTENEDEKILRIDVEVNYRYQEGDDSAKSRRSVKRSVLKHGEKNV